MKVLVTGSEGFLGKHVVKELEKKKYDVIKYDINRGKNIFDEKELEKNLKNVEIVVHIAGIVKGEKEDVEKINIEGTKKILQKSIEKRVKKFVLLSSTGVYGITDKIVDENSELKPKTVYEKSKREAENIVLNRQEEIHVNVIRSAMIFGVNEYWAKMFKMLEKNYPLPCSGKNCFQIVYVKEVARAVVKVIEKGEPSEIYLAAGKEKWALKEFCEKTKKELTGKGKIRSVPKIIALVFGKVFGNKLLDEENIRHLSKERKYITDNIEKIGYEQKTCLEEAIKETIREMKKQKLL